MSSYVNKKSRVFTPQGTHKVIQKRSESRLKTIRSASDNRAWTDCIEDKRQYILELIKSKAGGLSLGKYIPIEVIIDVLLANKNAQIAELQKQLDAYKKLKLTDEQRRQLTGEKPAVVEKAPDIASEIRSVKFAPEEAPKKVEPDVPSIVIPPKEEPDVSSKVISISSKVSKPSREIEPEPSPKIESEVSSKVEPEVEPEEVKVEPEISSKVESEVSSKVEPEVEPEEIKVEPEVVSEVSSKVEPEEVKEEPELVSIHPSAKTEEESVKTEPEKVSVVSSVRSDVDISEPLRSSFQKIVIGDSSLVPKTNQKEQKDFLGVEDGEVEKGELEAMSEQKDILSTATMNIEKFSDLAERAIKQLCNIRKILMDAGLYYSGDMQCGFICKKRPSPCNPCPDFMKKRKNQKGQKDVCWAENSTAIDSLEESLEEMTGMDGKVQNLINQLKNKEDCSQYKRDLEKSKENSAKYEKDLSNCKEENDRLRKKLNEIDGLNKKIAELEKELKCKKETFCKMEKENSYYRCEMENCRYICKERDMLQRQVGDLECCIADLEEEIKKLVDHIDRLTVGRDKQQARTRSAMADMREKLEEKTSIIQISEEKLAEVQEKLEESIKGVVSETSMFKNRIEELDAIIVNLKNELVEKDLEIEEKRKKLEEKSRELEDKSKEIEEKRKEIDDKRKEIDDKRKEVDERSKEIEERNKELNSARSAKSVVDTSAMNTLKSDLANSIRQSEELQKELEKVMMYKNNETCMNKMLKQSGAAIKKVKEEIARQYKEWELSNSTYGSGDPFTNEKIEEMKEKILLLETETKTTKQINDELKNALENQKKHNDLANLENCALKKASREIQNIAKCQVDELLKHIQMAQTRIIDLEDLLLEHAKLAEQKAESKDIEVSCECDTEELEKLKKENEFLKKELGIPEESKKEEDSKKVEKEEDSSRLITKEGSNTDLLNEIQRLKNEIASLESDKLKLEKENENLKTKGLDLEEKGTSDDEKEKLRKDVNSLEDALNAEKEISDDLRKKLEECQKENEKLKATATSTVGTSADNTDELQNKLNECLDKQKKLEEKLEDLEKQLNDSKDREKRALDASNSALEKLKNAGNNNAELEDLQKKLNDSVEREKKATEASNAALEKLKQAQDTKEQELADLQRKLSDSMENEKKAKEASNTALEKLKNLQENDTNKTSQELEDLENKLKTSNTALEDNQKEINRLKTALEENVDMYRKEKQASSMALLKQEEDLKNLENENEALREQSNELLQKLTETERLKLENEKLKKKLEDMSTDNDYNEIKEQLQKCLNEKNNLDYREDGGTEGIDEAVSASIAFSESPREDILAEIDRLTRELMKERADCKNTIKTLKDQYDREIKNLKNTSNLSINKLQELTESQIKEMEMEHESIVSSLKDELKSNLEELKSVAAKSAKDPTIKESKERILSTQTFCVCSEMPRIVPIITTLGADIMVHESLPNLSGRIQTRINTPLSNILNKAAQRGMTALTMEELKVIHAELVRVSAKLKGKIPRTMKRALENQDPMSLMHRIEELEDNLQKKQRSAKQKVVALHMSIRSVEKRIAEMKFVLEKEKSQNSQLKERLHAMERNSQIIQVERETLQFKTRCGCIKEVEGSRIRKMKPKNAPSTSTSSESVAMRRSQPKKRSLSTPPIAGPSSYQTAPRQMDSSSSSNRRNNKGKRPSKSGCTCKTKHGGKK